MCDCRALDAQYVQTWMNNSTTKNTSANANAIIANSTSTNSADSPCCVHELWFVLLLFQLADSGGTLLCEQ